MSAKDLAPQLNDLSVASRQDVRFGDPFQVNFNFMGEGGNQTTYYAQNVEAGTGQTGFESANPFLNGSNASHFAFPGSFGWNFDFDHNSTAQNWTEYPDLPGSAINNPNWMGYPNLPGSAIENASWTEYPNLAGSTIENGNSPVNVFNNSLFKAGPSTDSESSFSTVQSHPTINQFQPTTIENLSSFSPTTLAGPTPADLPHITSDSPGSNVTDLVHNTAPEASIQKEKPRNGRSKASGVMIEAGNSLVAQLQDVVANAPLHQSIASETRRSARTTVPSKRCDQMNQIGSKNTPLTSAAEKENIPPNTMPDWAIAAKEHLLGMELGAEWRVCVQCWVELESALGYGSIAGSKVNCSYMRSCRSDESMHYNLQAALPAVTLRPEEWSKWVVKTRGGERPYQDLPTILDPAEFGMAIVKWWNGMQPAFRQTSEGMPQPLYNTPATEAKHAWAPLQRAGPNGLVTLLTLLFWWGKSLKTQTCWQDDSDAAWKEAINDVARTLQLVKQASASGSKKRKGTNVGKENVGKRRVKFYSQ